MDGLNLNNKTLMSESLNSSPFTIFPSFLPFQSHIPVHPQVNLLYNQQQIFSFLPLARIIPSSLSNCYPSCKISLKTTTFQNSFYLYALTWSFLLLSPLLMLNTCDVSYLIGDPRAQCLPGIQEVLTSGVFEQMVYNTGSFKETLACFSMFGTVEKIH